MSKVRTLSAPGTVVSPKVTKGNQATRIKQTPEWVNEVGLAWLYRLFVPTQQGHNSFELLTLLNLFSNRKSIF